MGKKSCRFQSAEPLFTTWDHPRRGGDRSVLQDRQPQTRWILPQLLDLGLLGMIGKDARAARSKAVVRNGAVYFAAVSGTGALLSKSIREAEVVACEDLGTGSNPELAVEGISGHCPWTREGTDLCKPQQKNTRKICIRRVLLMTVTQPVFVIVYCPSCCRGSASEALYKEERWKHLQFG